MWIDININDTNLPLRIKIIAQWASPCESIDEILYMEGAQSRAQQVCSSVVCGMWKLFSNLASIQHESFCFEIWQTCRRKNVFLTLPWNFSISKNESIHVVGSVQDKTFFLAAYPGAPNVSDVEEKYFHFFTFFLNLIFFGCWMFSFTWCTRINNVVIYVNVYGKFNEEIISPWTPKKCEKLS